MARDPVDYLRTGRLLCHRAPTGSHVGQSQPLMILVPDGKLALAVNPGHAAPRCSCPPGPLLTESRIDEDFSSKTPSPPSTRYRTYFCDGIAEPGTQNHLHKRVNSHHLLPALCFIHSYAAEAVLISRSLRTRSRSSLARSGWTSRARALKALSTSSGLASHRTPRTSQGSTS